jgi:hypothetical protein
MAGLSPMLEAKLCTCTIVAREIRGSGNTATPKVLSGNVGRINQPRETHDLR